MKYYEKAINNGFAEGIYNLAVLTFRGLGVKRDHKKAIDLLTKVAELPIDDYNKYWISECENCLGLSHNGLGLRRRPTFSESCFQREKELSLI